MLESLIYFNKNASLFLNGKVTWTNEESLCVALLVIQYPNPSGSRANLITLFSKYLTILCDESVIYTSRSHSWHAVDDVIFFHPPGWARPRPELLLCPTRPRRASSQTCNRSPSTGWFDSASRFWNEDGICNKGTIYRSTLWICTLTLLVFHCYYYLKSDPSMAMTTSL